MGVMEAVALYSGLNLLLLVYLALRVVRQRLKTQTSIGDGGHPSLALAIRVHGNAAEYVPAGLVGLAVLALAGAPVWAIHAAGGAFSVARLAHALGFAGGMLIGRQVGTALSWATLIAMALGLVFLAVT